LDDVYALNRSRQRVLPAGFCQKVAEGRAYLNYADRELTDYAHAYWGQNLERLQRIKAEYDPLNLFRGPQSIPPIDL